MKKKTLSKWCSNHTHTNQCIQTSSGKVFGWTYMIPEFQALISPATPISVKKLQRSVELSCWQESSTSMQECLQDWKRSYEGSYYSSNPLSQQCISCSLKHAWCNKWFCVSDKVSLEHTLPDQSQFFVYIPQEDWVSTETHKGSPALMESSSTWKAQGVSLTTSIIHSCLHHPAALNIYPSCSFFAPSNSLSLLGLWQPMAWG